MSPCVSQVAEVTDYLRLKKLNLKQMLQRLAIALAQSKVGKWNTANHVFFVLRKRNY